MDRYILGDVIGKGSYGEVYLCRLISESTYKYVCKKILLLNMKSSDIELSLKEVKLLTLLKHPCIVSIFDNFIDNNTLCIIMEYCNGGDLSKQIHDAKEPFSEDKILNWFVQIALSIQHCHKCHVLHRDLKTQNIYLTDNFLVKLGDFGIARVLETLELAQTVVGTPYTMSPEVCNSAPYSYKSDIWSLGCILFELCELKYPFGGTNLLSIVWKIVKEDVPPISKRYSQELADLVKWILNKDPDLRPSVDELLAHPLLRRQMEKLLYVAEQAPDTLALSSERTLRRQVSQISISPTISPRLAQKSPDNITPYVQNNHFLVNDAKTTKHEYILSDITIKSPNLAPSTPSLLTPKQILQAKKEAKIREQQDLMSKAALDAQKNFAAAEYSQDRNRNSSLMGSSTEYSKRSSITDQQRPQSGNRYSSPERTRSTSAYEDKPITPMTPSRSFSSYDDRPISGNRKPSLNDERPISGSRKPSIADERPITGSRNPSIIDDRPFRSAVRNPSIDERPINPIYSLDDRPIRHSSSKNKDLGILPSTPNLKPSPRFDQSSRDNLFPNQNMKSPNMVAASGKYDLSKLDANAFNIQNKSLNEDYEDDFEDYDESKGETEVEAWCSVLKNQVVKPQPTAVASVKFEDRPVVIDAEQKVIHMKNLLLEKMSAADFDLIYNYMKQKIDDQGNSRDISKNELIAKFGANKLIDCQQVESYIFFELQASKKFARV